MAAYPSYGILLESRNEAESSWRDSVSESGSLHSREMRSADYYRFTLIHNMTAAEFNALRATYDAGPRDTYTLTYATESPQITYSAKFTAPPQKIKNHGGGRYTVRVQLRGTED